jgi:hypothetical protein
MPLTELANQKCQAPARKTVRLFDARGLYLEISPTGGTYGGDWKYRYAGKESAWLSASTRRSV